MCKIMVSDMIYKKTNALKKTNKKFIKQKP